MRQIRTLGEVPVPGKLWFNRRKYASQGSTVLVLKATVESRAITRERVASPGKFRPGFQATGDSTGIVSVAHAGMRRMSA